MERKCNVVRCISNETNSFDGKEVVILQRNIIGYVDKVLRIHDARIKMEYQQINTTSYHCCTQFVIYPALRCFTYVHNNRLKCQTCELCQTLILMRSTTSPFHPPFNMLLASNFNKWARINGLRTRHGSIMEFPEENCKKAWILRSGSCFEVLLDHTSSGRSSFLSTLVFAFSTDECFCNKNKTWVDTSQIAEANIFRSTFRLNFKWTFSAR